MTLTFLWRIVKKGFKNRNSKLNKQQPRYICCYLLVSLLSLSVPKSKFIFWKSVRIPLRLFILPDQKTLHGVVVEDGQQPGHPVELGSRLRLGLRHLGIPDQVEAGL